MPVIIKLLSAGAICLPAVDNGIRDTHFIKKTDHKRERIILKSHVYEVKCCLKDVSKNIKCVAKKLNLLNGFFGGRGITEIDFRG